MLLILLLLQLNTIRADFEDLPGRNRAWLLGVVPRPLLALHEIIYDLVYQPPTKIYRSQAAVVLGIRGHVTTKHLPDTPR